MYFRIFFLTYLSCTLLSSLWAQEILAHPYHYDKEPSASKESSAEEESSSTERISQAKLFQAFVGMSLAQAGVVLSAPAFSRLPAKLPAWITQKLPRNWVVALSALLASGGYIVYKARGASASYGSMDTLLSEESSSTPSHKIVPFWRKHMLNDQLFSGGGEDPKDPRSSRGIVPLTFEQPDSEEDIPLYFGTGLHEYENMEELVKDFSDPMRYYAFSLNVRDDLLLVALEIHALAHRLMVHWDQLSDLHDDLANYEDFQDMQYSWLHIREHLHSGFTFNHITLEDLGMWLSSYSYKLKNYLRKHYPNIRGKRFFYKKESRRLNLDVNDKDSLSNYMEADAYNIQVAANKLAVASSWFMKNIDAEDAEDAEDADKELLSDLKLRETFVEFLHDFSENLYVSHVRVNEVLRSVPMMTVDSSTDVGSVPSAFPQLMRSFCSELRIYAHILWKAHHQKFEQSGELGELAMLLASLAEEVDREVYGSYVNLLDVPFHPSKYMDIFQDIIALNQKLPSRILSSADMSSADFVGVLQSMPEKLFLIRALVNRIQQSTLLVEGKVENEIINDHASESLKSLQRLLSQRRWDRLYDATGLARSLETP